MVHVVSKDIGNSLKCCLTLSLVERWRDVDGVVFLVVVHWVALSILLFLTHSSYLSLNWLTDPANLM